MIKPKNLSPETRALLYGLMVGNVYFTNLTAGDDNATGESFKRAVKTIQQAVLKTVTANHDYVIVFGSGTQTKAVTSSNTHLHIIGGGPQLASAGRGCAFTGMATTTNITSSGVFFELAGFQHVGPATDAVSVSTTGANAFIHHNTFIGSTTASDLTRVLSTGSYTTIANNIFSLCKLAIGVAGADSVIEGNVIQDVDIAAKGINLTANTADRCIIRNNIINLSGGTGDVGVTIISGANQCVLSDNLFHASCSDLISDSGTGTGIWRNFSTAITGTSGASIPLVVIT
jgi:hypothetical protein